MTTTTKRTMQLAGGQSDGEKRKDGERVFRLDAMQGDRRGMTFRVPGKARHAKSQLTKPAGQRTEPYGKYGEGVAQATTQQNVKSAGRVLGSAKKQASTAKKPFAVFDIDGTLIRWQLYHSLVDELAKQGHIKLDQHQRIKDARMTWKNRQHENTFSEYQSTLVDVFHNSLTNLPTKTFERAIETVFATYKDQVYTYTRDLLKQLKAKDYVLFAISGSHDEIIQKLAAHYGFDAAVGNKYERKAGTFTGRHDHVVDRKPEVLKTLIEKHNVQHGGSIAVGDSGSDASLLEVVERPIAFNPDKNLLAIAQRNGWDIVIERKNVVYKLEQRDDGYVLA